MVPGSPGRRRELKVRKRPLDQGWIRFKSRLTVCSVSAQGDAGSQKDLSIAKSATTRVPRNRQHTSRLLWRTTRSPSR